MQQMSEEGVTIVLSTHVLPQVEELCSDICLINRAPPILCGPLDRIRTDYGGNTWRVNTGVSAEDLATFAGVTSVIPLKTTAGKVIVGFLDEEPLARRPSPPLPDSISAAAVRAKCAH